MLLMTQYALWRVTPKVTPLAKKGYPLEWVTFFFYNSKKLYLWRDFCKPLSGFCVANKKNIYGKRKRLQAAEVFFVKSHIRRMLIDIVGADYRRLFLPADG